MEPGAIPGWLFRPPIRRTTALQTFNTIDADAWHRIGLERNVYDFS
jgi:hypothetical protein